MVNAFLHRSYETNGTVDVQQSPEWLVVTNPGGFLIDREMGVAEMIPYNAVLSASPTPRSE